MYPFPNATINSFKYFISFIGDFSWYGFAFLINDKSSALDVFKIYNTEVEHHLQDN